MRSPLNTSIETSAPLGMSDFRFEMGQEDWRRATGGKTSIATDYDGEDPSALTAPDSRSSQGTQSMGVPYTAGFVHGSSQDAMTSGPFYASLMGGGSYGQNQPISPSWTASSDMEAIMTGSSNLSPPHDLFSIPSPFTNQAQCVSNKQSYDIASFPMPTLDKRLNLQASGKTGYLAPPGSKSRRNPLHSPRYQLYKDWNEAQEEGPTPSLSFAVPTMRSVGESRYQLPPNQHLPFSPKAANEDQKVQVSALIGLKTTASSLYRLTLDSIRRL